MHGDSADGKLRAELDIICEDIAQLHAILKECAAGKRLSALEVTDPDLTLTLTPTLTPTPTPTPTPTLTLTLTLTLTPPRWPTRRRRRRTRAAGTRGSAYCSATRQRAVRPPTGPTTYRRRSAPRWRSFWDR